MPKTGIVGVVIRVTTSYFSHSSQCQIRQTLQHKMFPYNMHEAHYNFITVHKI